MSVEVLRAEAYRAERHVVEELHRDAKYSQAETRDLARTEGLPKHVAHLLSAIAAILRLWVGFAGCPLVFGRFFQVRNRSMQISKLGVAIL